VNIEPSDLRISDTEREDAISKLGEHMSVGRIGLDEYGERTAKVAAAKTRGDLLALFTDLPDPRPSFGQTVTATRAQPSAAVPPPYQPPPARSGSWDNRPVAQRVWGALVPLSAIIALILFLTVIKVWFVFLIPAVVAIIGGAIWGEDWRHSDGHGHRQRYRHGRRHRY
jgi:hypothetical protein